MVNILLIVQVILNVLILNKNKYVIYRQDRLLASVCVLKTMHVMEYDVVLK